MRRLAALTLAAFMTFLSVLNAASVRAAPVRGITGARVLCVGMGDIGSNFARRAHMLGAEVVGVRRMVHPDTPCPDYCLRVVAQSR